MLAHGVTDLLAACLQVQPSQGCKCGFLFSISCEWPADVFWSVNDSEHHAAVIKSPCFDEECRFIETLNPDLTRQCV